MPWLAELGVLLAAALLASLPFRPLFYQNQNTKYLYGLAHGGFGNLREDWLVEQGSNLPIFDAIVLLTERMTGLWMFHGWRVLTMFVFAVALYGLARLTLRGSTALAADGKPFLLIFSLCFVAINSNNGTGRLFEGFAHQYVSSHVFEPASFGVLSLLALLLFRLREPGWAAVLIVCAAWVHPVYAIPGLLLLTGMGIARWRFGADAAPFPAAVWLGGVVGCFGSAAFTYSQLFPMDPASQAEALRIITTIRIPHHALPEVWIDFDAVVKLAVLAAAIAVVWRDPLGVVFLTATAGTVAFTLWVYVTRDLSLALAGPWRVSAIIVPAANAILLGRGIELAYAWSEGNAGRRRLGIAATVVAAAVGIGAAANKLVQDRSRPPPAYYAWVRTHAAPGQQYLTPVEDEQFRLLTGQPQYANWKSHPHRAEAVLEWYRRFAVAQHLTGSATITCDDLSTVAKEGVTHFVRGRSQPWPGCSNWRSVYRDDRVAVWQYLSRTASGPNAPLRASP